MPLRMKDNTKYPPIRIKDLVYRDTTPGIESFIPEDIQLEINEDWIYFLMQVTEYKGITTDYLTSRIYEMYSSRVIYDRYTEDFYDWDETNDFQTFAYMINTTIYHVLKTNAEKYRKIYESQFLKFHPEWNVDGEEITERELNMTGTDAHAKTGDDSTTKTGNYETEKLGSEASTRTGNEKTDYAGTDTETISKTTYDSTTFYDVEKRVNTPTTKNDTLTYNNVKDEQTFTGRKDKTTYNTLKDKTDYNSTDTETRNMKDTERTVYIRHGNIGVVSTVRLLLENVELAEKVDFVGSVARDIVNAISYMTY